MQRLSAPFTGKIASIFSIGSRLAGLPVVRWWTAAIASIVLLWLVVGWQTRVDQQTAVTEGRIEAEQSAAAFAEQIEDLIDQSDQTLIFLRHLRQQSASDAAIERLRGDLPSHRWLRPNFIDSSGIIRGAQTRQSIGISVADQVFFHRIQADPSGALTIHPPAPGVGTLTGRSVIRLTRRVNTPAGDFDGILSIPIPADVFVNHRKSTLTGATDVSMVSFRDGMLLANSASSDAAPIDPASSEPAPSDRRAGAPARSTVAQATSLASARQLLERGDRYFVAQASLPQHQLDVLVALDRRVLLAPMARERLQLQLLAALATFGILIVSGWATWRHTRQHAAQERSRHVWSVFRQAVDDSKDEFFMLTPVRTRAGEIYDFRLDECNVQAASAVARRREEIVGQPLGAMLTPANWRATHDFLSRAAADGFAEKEAHVYRAGLAQKRWLACRATRVEDGLAVTLRDITELKEKAAQLEQLALTDGLTGLPNRHWVNRELPALLKRAAAEQEYVAALFIDLDNFKTINDTLGHLAGDEYLKAVAAGIRQVVRKDDVVVRLGGDEFLVLALHLDEFQLATRVALGLVERIREVGQQGRWASANPRASVGIAAYPMDARNATDLVQAADIAMYEAKRNGKDRFEVFVPTMRDRLREELSLETGLRKAIAEGALSLRFQPRASAASGHLLGFEALARWDHPVMGPIPPTRFVPLAEKHDLINDLGCWVVEEVCRTLVQWRASDRLLHPVSVNVSVKQLKTPAFREHLAACVKRYAVPPAQIELELTESTMVADDPAVKRELRLLSEMGHKLMIDDFGTGYSSLAQLQQLRVDVLKIDGSFVRNLSSGDEGKTICAAMIQIGKTLGIDVVAEGVETRQQLEQLQRFGCDEVQGFLLAQPMLADDAAALLDQRILFSPETLELSEPLSERERS